MVRAVKIIEDEELAKLLTDPMRRTILGLLSDREMTETQLSQALGLTEAAVGHHLRLLEKADLVGVVRKVPEYHGIIQKFYRSSFLYFVIDYRKMPQVITRYFFSVNMVRARGILSAVAFMSNRRWPFNSEIVEEFAERLTHQLVEVATEYGESEVELDREALIINLYSEALGRVLQGSGKIARSLREVVYMVRKGQHAGEIPTRRRGKAGG